MFFYCTSKTLFILYEHSYIYIYQIPIYKRVYLYMCIYLTYFINVNRKKSFSCLSPALTHNIVSKTLRKDPNYI